MTRLGNLNVHKILDRGGLEGVRALSRATPTETGLAKSSWYHEVTIKPGEWAITWFNGDVENGFHVALMLQYGHGTGTGGYVAGRDYINPALRPVFDKIADDVWKAVKNA